MLKGSPDCVRIAVELDCPRVNKLSAALFKRREWNEITLNGKSGFLAKLAFGGRQWIFPFFDLAFRDRPCAGIFSGPEWSARMAQEYFQAGFSPAVQQQPGSFLVRHA